MLDGRGDAVARLNDVARSLVGRRITDITYYGLSSDRQADIPWDFDTWHQPVMGVELTLDDRSRYSAVWGSTFGHFGLEVFTSPMTEHLILEEAGGTVSAWSVANHPRWTGLTADPVSASSVFWDLSTTDGSGPAPLALRLDFPSGTGRIVAAQERSDGEFWIGSDEVIVGFSDEFAARLGSTGTSYGQA